MNKLSSILRDSFAIWTRSFTLIYVFFLFLLLVTFIVGNPTRFLALGGRDLLLLPGLGLLIFMIFGAVMAGFYAMVATVCQKSLAPDVSTAWNSGQKPKTFTAGFQAFSAFLPGIGQLFLPITIGYGIQFAVIPLTSWFFIKPLLHKAMPVLKLMAAQPLENGLNPEQFIHSLNMPQLLALNNLLMGIIVAFLIYGVFYVMTMLWPIMLVLYTRNPLKAYGQSLRQFFRDPLRLIGLGLLFYILYLACSVLSLAPGVFLNIFSQMAFYLLQIFIAISLCVYAWRRIGQPTLSLSDQATVSTSKADRPS